MEMMNVCKNVRVSIQFLTRVLIDRQFESLTYVNPQFKIYFCRHVSPAVYKLLTSFFGGPLNEQSCNHRYWNLFVHW